MRAVERGELPVRQVLEGGLLELLSDRALVHRARREVEAALCCERTSGRRISSVHIGDAQTGESELLSQKTELCRERGPARVRRVARDRLLTNNTILYIQIVDADLLYFSKSLSY